MRLLEAVRPNKEAHRLAHENAVLAEIGRVISSSLHVDEVYERVAEQVKKLVCFDRIAITVADEQGEFFTAAYVSGQDVPGRRMGDRTPLAGSVTQEVIRAKRGLVINADSKQAPASRFPTLSADIEAGLRSMISVPLIAKDSVVGVLHLRSTKPNAYTERDLALAERVAFQIAGAVANAQLHAALEREAQERALLQEQLLQSQKMEAIGRLAGGIAHDFNNLLTPIIGFADVAMRTVASDSRVRGHIQHIHEAASRASNLVRQLLTFSRRQVVEQKVMDLSRLVLEMDGILRRIIGEDVELITRPKPQLWLVRQDPGQMEQVLINLAVNARDAMPGGGRLIIELDNATIDEVSGSRHPNLKPGDYVVLAVRDNGTGMDESTRTHIFEPFFTTKGVGKGTGLGLATCYGIVTQNGGAIEVESQLGQGTTFNIYLPRVEGVVETAAPEGEAYPMLNGTETILLVEDELSVREIAAYVLREQGYKVLEAASGKEALRTVEDSGGDDIDLLLTDVVMPGMSGAELATHFAEICPGRSVIFTSGYATEAIVQHGVKKDGLVFIQKPFTPEILTHKVREVLDSSL
ncbi:MAG: ATP-binding protein [Chloroflexi bacterium]|nr:ATP-binding protein [Chloroflexota bacterium]